MIRSRNDADRLVAATSKLESLAQHVGGGSEVVRSETVAECDDPIPARLSLLFGEQAADRWLDAKNVEEGRVVDGNDQLLGPVATADAQSATRH